MVDLDKSATDLIAEFIAAGGQEADIEGVTEVSDLQDLVDVQNHFFKNKVKMEELKPAMMLTKNDLVSKLHELEQVTTVDMDTDEFAQHNSEYLHTQNLLREKIDLPPINREYVDDDLKVALHLDGGFIGPTCQELLDKFEEHSAERHSMKRQLDDMLSQENLYNEIAENESKRLAQLELAFNNLSAIPEKFIPKDGVMSENKAYMMWAENALKLRQKLLRRKRYHEQTEGSFDERSKESIMLKTISKVLIEVGMLEDDYESD